MKGATVFVIGHINRKLYFNPRTREGCDPPLTIYPTFLADFNPRTREGCDKDLLDSVLNIIDFNPRTREGCDSETA